MLFNSEILILTSYLIIAIFLFSRGSLFKDRITFVKERKTFGNIEQDRVAYRGLN